MGALTRVSETSFRMSCSQRPKGFVWRMSSIRKSANWFVLILFVVELLTYNSFTAVALAWEEIRSVGEGEVESLDVLAPAQEMTEDLLAERLHDDVGESKFCEEGKSGKWKTNFKSLCSTYIYTYRVRRPKMIFLRCVTHLPAWGESRNPGKAFLPGSVENNINIHHPDSTVLLIWKWNKQR